jgi:tetratricopeptide (TPR) repeat protein
MSVAQTLVDRAFAAMDAVSAAVKPRRRSRHLAILLRCDVLREPRAVVARDLGLSLPQFERERRDAMGRFVACVQNVHSGKRPKLDGVRSGLANTVRERAMRLADSGDRQSALRLLDDIVRTASPREKIEAFVAISDIETGDHGIGRSRAALDSAAALLRAEPIDDVSSGLRLAYEAANLRLRAVEHGPQTAAKLLRAHDELPRRPESVTLLVAQAEVLDSCGKTNACVPFVLKATELLRNVQNVDPATRIDLAFLESQIKFWRDPAARGRDGLDAALCAARTAGYEGRAAYADLLRLGSRWSVAGDIFARRNYRALLDKIGRTKGMPRQAQFYAYWDAADIECSTGDPWRAAEAARNALRLAPNALAASPIKGLMARAYTRGGRPEVGERIACEIIDDRNGSRAGKALLTAKLILADVASVSRRPKQAWESLQDAANLSEQYGSAHLAAMIQQRLTAFRSLRFHRFLVSRA